MKRALIGSLLLVLVAGVAGCGNAELQKQLDEVSTKLADAEKRIVELEEELKTVTAERDELKAKSEAKAPAPKKPVAAKATPTPAPQTPEEKVVQEVAPKTISKPLGGGLLKTKK